MLRKLNLYNFSTISVSAVLGAIALIFLIVALPLSALGQSKTILVSIIKGASIPTMKEPYNPSPTNIAKGTTVTWTNHDNTAHTVTAWNCVYSYICYGRNCTILLHPPTMLGEVIVK